jgi:phosphatidylglycerophosphate synthase
MALILFLRYMADNLDGAIARKYNKCSELGGYFDTFSDNMMFSLSGFAVTYLFCKYFKMDNWRCISWSFLVFAILSTSHFYYLYDKGCLVSHEGLIKKDGSFTNFMTRNVYLLYLSVFLFYLLMYF